MQRDAFTVDPAIFELGNSGAWNLLRDATDNASVRWEGRIVLQRVNMGLRKSMSLTRLQAFSKG